MKDKKVLIIAYHFPPIGGSGMQRTVKFVKYLLSFGWHPVVLTVTKGKSYEIIDDALLDEVPKEIKVYRTPWFNPRGIINIPDRKVGWVFFAFLKGLNVIKKENIDIIYSTSPTVSAHLIGYFLKKFTKLKWVADFRDPWIANPTKINMKGVRRKIETFLEKKVISSANKVIANTNVLKADFEKRYPAINKDKFITIINGYDPQDFEDVNDGNHKLSSDIFVITHTGEFYENLRNPNIFLMSVGALLKEGFLSKDNIIINFVGGGDYVNTKKYKQLVQENNLWDIINVVNHVPHNDSIRYLFSSHVLLLLTFSHGKMQIPAKTYEYIKSGRSILALADDGATEQILKDIPTATVVRPNDIDAIKNAISELYLKFKNKTLEINIDEKIKEKFSRKLLTQCLASLFDSLCSYEQNCEN